MTLIQDLRVMREKLLMGGPSVPHTAFNRIENILDRLYQLIQMLISSECLDRNEIRM
jgi:hypothetical protein